MPTFSGTNGSEGLTGSSTSDIINGLGGSDTLLSDDGNDTVAGGEGHDEISGGAGNDTLYGHSIADRQPGSGRITATEVANIGQGALFVTAAPGDAGHIYTLNKGSGEIARIDPATGAQTTFLDIDDDLFSSVGEGGTLGLAFHPDYAANGRFFVFLTTPAGDIEVVEYARDPGNPAAALANPVATVLSVSHQPFSNHNGGSLVFGPDGYLYISTGDGGGSNDPGENAQDPDVLLGKILRIDVDGDDFTEADRNYAIPADNPFAGGGGADEIWALGLRNPWRISFDPLTGDLYIGDVGQSAREEVDFQTAGSAGGANYGWDFREGSVAGPSAPGSGSFIEPVFDYDRSVGQSITGGEVLRGNVDGLEGAYLFGDFVSGRLFSLRMVDGVAEDAIDRTSQLAGDSLGNISSFGRDNEGNVYAVNYSGAILRLDPGAAAGDGADRIDGGSGADVIYGGVGGDALDGGDGDDILTGGAHADALDGGSGADTASYATSTGSVRVSLLSGNGADNDAAGDSLTGVESLVGSLYNDILTGTSSNNALRGGFGNDIIRPYQGGDFINGGAGTDIVDYTYTAIALDINLTVNSVTRVDGHKGPGGYNQSIYNIEFVRGTFGNDRIRGDLDADSTIYAYDGDDILIGYRGADRLIGGDGNDRMSGGGGEDALYGQAGADWFYATGGMARDRVMDWQDSVDRLNFSAVAGVDSFADINVSNGSLGAFVWWDDPADGIWLVGRSTGTIDAGDFMF